MEFFRRFLLITAIMLTVFSASISGGGPQAGQTMIVTADDNGKEITVDKGTVFEVRLQQHSGTGYLWQIAGLDENHLKVLQSAETPLSQAPIVGGPLLITWKIEALKAGETDLNMLLYRSWEGPGKAAERFQVRVHIR
jgi:predicted secreted protein